MTASVPQVAINQDDTLLGQLPGFDGKQIVVACLTCYNLISSVSSNIRERRWN